MSNFSDRRLPWLIAGLALVIFTLAGMLGGSGAVADVGTMRLLGAERDTHGALTSAAIAMTAIGGARGMIAILVVSMALIGHARGWRPALLIGCIVLGGRGAVELIKLVIARPRPHFSPYPVDVASLSFPSGHAANSMMTFLTLALLTVTPRYRVMAVTAAVCLSVVIGSTRPFLGVHWPSDVVGGWAFGIAWVVTLAKASDYWPAFRENRAT